MVVYSMSISLSTDDLNYPDFYDPAMLSYSFTSFQPVKFPSSPQYRYIGQHAFQQALSEACCTGVRFLGLRKSRVELHSVWDSMANLSDDSLLVLDASFIDSCSSSFLERFDVLGQESGRAQLLSGPITSVEKLRHSNHTVVVFVNELGEPDGFAKVGAKDLFFYQKNGNVVERSQAPCLLDFYVSENLQRRGIGLHMFTRALQVLCVDAATKIAYDRPSPKLLAFLSKHFDLRNGDLQPNRFMIFDGFL